MQKRATGFVMSIDMIDDKVVQKVRVKDESSEFNGQKCVVVSVRDNITLNVGFDVDFFIATAQERGREVLKAVDVQLHATTEVQSVEGQDADTKETINFFFASYGEKLRGWVTGHKTRDEVQHFLIDSCGGDVPDEEIVSFLSFSADDVEEKSPDSEDCIRALSSLAACSDMMYVFDSLATKIFKLGQQSVRNEQ